VSDRAPYSRVYHSIVDDPKFAKVYDDDRRLATWLRLLIVAEQAHPASAYIPAGTHRGSVIALADAGLIDLGTGSRYRIHGLDAERGRRAEAARVGGLASGRSRSVERPLNGGSRSKRTESNLDEQSKDETSKDETSTARDPANTYWTLTGKYPVGNSLSWIDQLAQAFGPEAVADELAKAFAEDPRASTLIGRAQDRLRAGTRTAPQSKKPRVLEPWQEEQRAAYQAHYDAETPIVPAKRESA
jgi:hypothetical protein